VFSGMLGVTVFGIFLTPVFYVVLRWVVERNAANGNGNGSKDAIVPEKRPEKSVAAAV
jgi:hypothetical protein